MHTFGPKVVADDRNHHKQFDEGKSSYLAPHPILSNSFFIILPFHNEVLESSCYDM